MTRRRTIFRWTRRLWMRCAALSCAGAVPFWIWANLGDAGRYAAQFRIGAQIQFVHAMASFACATFMNLGAADARRAPAFFLSGALLLSGSLYLTPFMPLDLLVVPGIAGVGALVAGWCILIIASGQVDRLSAAPSTPWQSVGAAPVLCDHSGPCIDHGKEVG
ncbi:DUF423 domain-containing protein [Sphingobium sp. sgz301303]